MRCLAAIALISLILLEPIGARAHGILERSIPRAGSTVRIAPEEVSIWFTQRPEPAFSTITVINAAGERVDVGVTRVNGNLMQVSLRPIGAGTYQVTWRILSVDTHTTQGTFVFHVRP